MSGRGRRMDMAKLDDVVAVSFLALEDNFYQLLRMKQLMRKNIIEEK